MENIYLKDGGKFKPQKYISSKGFDVIGSEGSALGAMNVFSDEKRGDVKLKIRNRETGRTAEWDVYNFLEKKGLEGDKALSFQKHQEIVQAENEASERASVDARIQSMKDEYGIDFGEESVIGAELGRGHKLGLQKSMDLFQQVAFPSSLKTVESGKGDERTFGLKNKSWASLADMYSLVGRTPVAALEHTMYKLSDGKMGKPFEISMSDVADYGLNVDASGKEETIGEHFSTLKEVFRMDPKRVGKDLLRESVRDPVGSISLLAMFASGGATAPIAGSRAAALVANLAGKYKAFHKVKTAAQLVKKTKIAQGVGKTMEVMRKVSKKLEGNNIVQRSLVKAGYTTAGEGFAGGMQGYIGKAMHGGDATWKDFMVEGIEEGAFGLTMSAFSGIKRETWGGMSKEEKSDFMEDMRDNVMEVEEKLDNGVDPSLLSIEEAKLVALTKHGESQMTLDQEIEGPAPVKIAPNGDLLANDKGEVKTIDPYDELPPNVDKNDVQKKRENPAHVDKGTKNLEIREKAQRTVNSKNIKTMKTMQNTFDSEMDKGLEAAFDEVGKDMEQADAKADKEKAEGDKAKKSAVDNMFDLNKDSEFSDFHELVKDVLPEEEIQAAYVNYKSSEMKSKDALKALETEKSEREVSRKELLEKGKQIKGKSISVTKDVTLKAEGGKIKQSDYKKVKADMESKGKTAGDEAVRNALITGYVIVGKKKVQRTSEFSKADANRDVAYQRRSLEEQMETDPTQEMYTEGVKASNAPLEFTTHGNYYKRVNSRDLEIVKYKDTSGRIFEFEPSKIIYTDPLHQQPLQFESTRNLSEEELEFSERVLGGESLQAREPVVKTSPEEEIESEINFTIAVTHIELEAATKSAEELKVNDAQPGSLGKSSEGSYLEDDVVAAEIIKTQVLTNVNEAMAIAEGIKAGKKTTESEEKAVAIADFLGEQRLAIDEKLAEKAKLHKRLKSLHKQQQAALERIGRASIDRADKITSHSKEFDKWASEPEAMVPPPKPPVTEKQEATAQKAYEAVDEINVKIHEVEQAIEDHQDLDNESYRNQNALNILKMAMANNFKSFKDGAIGIKPEKYSKNVSAVKWDRKIKEIQLWKIKEAGIEQMLASAFPELHQISPALADMAGKMAWKNKIPNTLKDAKNKANTFLVGQRGALDMGAMTLTVREALKFGAFTALTGGPLGGVFTHGVFNYLMPKMKKIKGGAIGKFTITSVRAQLNTRRALQRIVPLIDQAFLLKNNRINKANNRYKKAVKGLDADEKIEMRDYIEGRNKNVNEKVQAAGEYMIAIFLEISKLANQHGFEFDENLNYFPRIFNWTAVQEMKSEEGSALMENEVQNLMKNEDMTREDASATLVAFYDNSADMQAEKSAKNRQTFYEIAEKKSGKSKMAFHYIVSRNKAKMSESVTGSLSFKRKAPRLTNAMYIEDIDSVMENYIHGAMQSITYREKFGEGMQVINSALMAEFSEKITKEGKEKSTGNLTDEGVEFKKYIEADLFNRSLVWKIGSDPNSLSSKTVAGLTRFQYWSKLMTSFLSPVKNMLTAGGMANSIHGLSANGMGFLRLLGGLVKGQPFRAAHLAGAITDRVMTDAMGTELFKKNFLERFIEPIHPFSISEKFVRSWAYNTGITAAHRMFASATKGGKKGLKNLQELNKILGPERASRDIASGQLSTESMELIASAVSFDIAGEARVLSLSPFLSTAEGKLIGQYRRIAFQQTVVLKNKIILPATKGDVLPLMRWGATVGVGATMIGYLMAMVYGESEDERDWSTPGRAAWNFIEFANQINALGLYGDLAASFEKGTGFGSVPVVGTFTGPTVSDFIHLLADGMAVGSGEEEAGDTIEKALKRTFPGIKQAGGIFDIESFK